MAIAAVLVIGAAITTGVLVSKANRKAEINDVIAATEVHPRYPVRAADGVVTAGTETAGRTIDLYEDLICPGCGGFNRLYADAIEKELDAGRLRVRYHVLAYLDQSSVPPGYSERGSAAAYAMAVHSPSRFPSFLRSLYRQQVQEGEPGYTDEQLVSLGQRLGADERFAADVREGTWKPMLRKALRAAAEEVDKATGRVALPTVLSSGRQLDTSDPRWLGSTER
ncbi:DsbA family protein [Sciscionella marina]|uniref:DsbA family protein n=1 Tax=Sciscionella marina TaxID=508770 RepID=UPI000372F4BD|nr:thioredoxin domain-containing protein [Sciscionella marina]